ncbi:aminotransferase class III-fold pyridoxal phosphate-dependent enzyme [Halorussus gelatinilyticus]|uniref:Aminotransferase class III-fold pyridoxal phosphate-dependent enzyme n=1 Tax=Halorussus gelatinilyticus TaxID=2937524 RepID=A0A8U0IIS5_9EURY|nr:aminotransferase class III-fold pyridoxal phosphate-dependent enzyme [Halorussus gelatinilyticus]UPW00596.1 aminotransferase class III-fold pyridoxal phosphate-dependent enzyme [Halorussus gelatinilyticus]
MDRDTAEPTVEDMPGKRAEEWADFHHQFSAPSTYVYDFVWDFTAPAEGPFCTDVDGNVLLDFTSHVASAPLGYNNPKIMEKFEEFDLVDPLKIAGQDFYAAGGWPPEEPELPGPTQLMDRLTDLTSHYDLDTVFLSNSGAEAVENAIKISYAQGGRRAFTFDGAFHGRTLGALSLNRSKVNHRKGYPEIGGVVSVPYPSTEEDYREKWLTDGPGGNVVADKLDPEQGVIDPEEVAYLILEPVQGEGGYRVPHDGFIADLAAIRERFDVTVISDEIQAGMGRTGEMWGIDHLDLEPDVITSAKGLRAGATVANSDLFPKEKARLSSTWGAGKIVDSMQGVFTIDAIHEHDLLANATERGRQMTELLEDANLPNVTDVRGRGLMLAVEFDTKERREAVVKAALKRGLLVLGCGYKTLRLLPPLDVTEREIELAFDLFRASVEDVA